MGIDPGLEKMKRRFAPLTFAIAIAAFGICTISSLAAGTAADSGPPTLSYIDGAGSVHHWIFWNARSRTKRVFLETAKEPRLIFWDTSKREVYYALGSRIFIANYGESRPLPSFVAKLPRSDLRLMWKEQSSSKLRVISIDDVPERNIIKDSKGVLVYRLADGSRLPAPDFPDGVPAVCTVFELSSGGKWIVVGKRATKTEAGDAPGIDVVTDLRHEDGISQDRLLMSYTYPYGDAGGRASDVPRDVIPLIPRASDYSVNDFSYIAGRGGLPSLLFLTVTGDTSHAEEPVFFVTTGPQLERIKLPPERYPDGQLGLGLDGRYLLIASEYDGENPIVIDRATRRVIFSAQGTGAVWLPVAPRD